MPNFCSLGNQAHARILVARPVAISRYISSSTHSTYGGSTLVRMVLLSGRLPPSRSNTPGAWGKKRKSCGGDLASSFSHCSTHLGNCQFRFCRLLWSRFREQWESATAAGAEHNERTSRIDHNLQLSGRLDYGCPCQLLGRLRTHHCIRK